MSAFLKKNRHNFPMMNLSQTEIIDRTNSKVFIYRMNRKVLTRRGVDCFEIFVQLKPTMVWMFDQIGFFFNLSGSTN